MDAFLSDYWLLLTLLGIALGLHWLARNSLYFRYVRNRFLTGLGILALVSAIVFALMEVLPGDCAEKYMAYKNTQGLRITEADIDAERRRMGLDQPLVLRWLDWARGVTTRGDLGFSCTKRQSVNAALGDRFWMSFGFCVAGLLLAYAIALPFGILSAVSIRQGLHDHNPRHSPWERRWHTLGLWGARGLDILLRFVSYLGLALPNFLLALSIILLYVFAGEPAPVGLMSDAFREVPWWDDSGFRTDKLFDLLGHIWLPIFVIGWAATALQLQTVRALVVDESNKLYVEAARARGQSGAALWLRYPVRHAISPLFNSIGFDFTRIFNDLPVVAVVIGLTDASALLIEALAYSNDQEMAAGILFLVALVVVSLNFVTDVVLAAVDPRIRAGVLGSRT